MGHSGNKFETTDLQRGGSYSDGREQQGMKTANFHLKVFKHLSHSVSLDF